MTRRALPPFAPNQGNWFDSQTYDPCVIVNPSDSTQLIMFFSGMGSPVVSGVQKIGRATASITDPYTWTISNSGNPVLSPTLAWETGSGLRANCVLYNQSNSKLYLFYTGNDTSNGVASSSDLGLTWTKLGQVLVPSADETAVSQLSVIIDGTTLRGIYSFRTAGAILPGYRYASASTNNWLSWTKTGVQVYFDPDSRNHEFHHFFKLGSTYFLVYESGSISTD
jgi:hypothetical protein